MTEEQKYDRWERFAKLFYEECLRASRESRKQTEKLKSLMEAKREYEAAELAVGERPEDPDRNENLVRAKKTLTLAYETLRR